MNTPHQTEFLRLVTKYLDGTATAKQKAAVERYFDLFSSGPDFLESATREQTDKVHDRLKAKIDQQIAAEEQEEYHEELTHPGLPWKYLSIAATILLAASIGMYLYFSSHQKVKPFSKKTAMVADVAPGSNKAVLTLSDGKQISLTDAENGQLASQDGTDINKTKDGELVYSRAGESDAIAYNSVATPRGGQYQLTLSDGTKVWLNAASILKYPTTFSGDERTVQLDGEAYFEVAHNASKPFRVISDRQTVEVLGTHFDINSYGDEPATRTSLIEGSVRVSKTGSAEKIVIRPGQQAIVRETTSGKIKIKNIDIDEAVAWKNGYFMFDEEPLGSILRKIARWYDVDIEYKGLKQDNDLYFSGTLSRYSNVSKVLDKLELTESVHFKIEGRKIFVMP